MFPTFSGPGGVVRLLYEDGKYVVQGPGVHEATRNRNQALGRINEILHRMFAGFHGPSGWSLLLQFCGIQVPYGDARVPGGGGGGGGSVSDLLGCVRAIYQPGGGPHDAVENAVAIVRHCWTAKEAAA